MSTLVNDCRVAVLMLLVLIGCPTLPEEGGSQASPLLAEGDRALGHLAIGGVT